MRLIPGFGQRGGLAIDGSHPAGDGLHPDPVVHTAHVRDVDEAAASRQASHSGTSDLGLLHLSEASGGLPEHEHHFRHPLIGCEAQSGRGCLQGIVLLCTQIVRQRPVLAAVHPVGDLIHAGEIVGPGDDGVQPHLGGKRIPPIKIVQTDIGIIGYAGQHIVHRLASHGLPGAALGDRHAGGQALVGHLEAKDLALMLQVGGQLGIAHAVICRGLDLLDGIAREREGLGCGQPPFIALDGIHQIPGLVVNLKHSPLQQRTGRQAVGGVVVGGLLHDLDLRSNLSRRNYALNYQFVTAFQLTA